jgi:hypothetical protein
MVNCAIIEKHIINDKKIISGLYLYTLDKHFISDVIFEICEDCFKMPSLPQGAFHVHKVKERNQHIAVCKKTCTDEKIRQGINRFLMALSPSKYNEKMMNSIWGRYNRNSPHNFKKNNAAKIGEVEAQQSTAAAKDLAKPKSVFTTVPPNQTPFTAAAVAAAGFGTGALEDHHGDLAEHDHHYLHGGHHGHHGIHEHSHEHFEQIWNFSVI